MFFKKKQGYQTAYGNYMYAEALEHYVQANPVYKFPEDEEDIRPKKKSRIWIPIVLILVACAIVAVLKILHKL